MLTDRTLALAAATAGLAAMLIAMATWHRTDAEACDLDVQTGLSQSRPADSNADAAYLPGLFIEEERAARIEPMPPQF